MSKSSNQIVKNKSLFEHCIIEATFSQIVTVLTILGINNDKYVNSNLHKNE